MKVGTILVISFIFIGLVGSLFGMYYFYTQSSGILESVAAHLETAVISRAHHIDTFLQDQKDKIEMIASSPIFKKLLE